MDLLLVDDDTLFAQTLARQLSRRGYRCHLAINTPEAVTLADQIPLDAVITDLVMEGASGLHLVQHLHQHHAHLPILVLTGYASITTAVEAIKLGARDYLAKPAHIDAILTALTQLHGNADLSIEAKPLSVNRLEWEHIQKILAEHDGNISATARALNMHRRTLQRKLEKRPHH